MINYDRLSSDSKILERKKSKIYGEFTMELGRCWKLLWVCWTSELKISSTFTCHIKDKTWNKRNYFVLGPNLTFHRRLSCKLIILSSHLFKEFITVSQCSRERIGYLGIFINQISSQCGQKNWSYHCFRISKPDQKFKRSSWDLE